MLFTSCIVTLLKRPIQSIGECTSCTPISIAGRKAQHYVTRQCRYNTSITDEYQAMLVNGKLQPDHHQLEVVKRLQRLQDELKDYSLAGNQSSWINKVTGSMLASVNYG